METATPDYEALALADGWKLGQNAKWWRPSKDDGSSYVNNGRHFRYICEDHDLVTAKA
jgi:hypothetical protein